MTTLLLAEHEHETLKDTTNKALTAATALGGEVHVLVAGSGSGSKSAAEAAAKLQGVAKVLVAEGEPYAHDLAEPMAARRRSSSRARRSSRPTCASTSRAMPHCPTS